MCGLIGYSGIVTKIRGMSSKLLTAEQFQELASMDNVAEAVEYLRQHTVYQSVLEGIPEGQMNRGEIERVLVRSYYQDYVKIYKFSNAKQRKMLKIYSVESELQILKRVLRRIFYPGHKNVWQVWDNELFHRYSSLDVEALNRTETIGELVEVLRKTPYYDTVARLANRKDVHVFDYEMALDLFYFSSIWERKDKRLKGKDLEVLTEVFGSQIDMLNMTWIYRAKEYYEIPPVGIYKLIIPIHYRLKESQIQEMAEAKDRSSLQKALESTYYGQRYQDLDGQKLEQLYQQVVRQIYQLARRRNPYSMTAVAAYLYEKELEIDKLTTILECVRYGLPSAEALEYISDRREAL